MKCKVLGKKKVQFTNKDTGELVRFAKIDVVHKFPPSDEVSNYEGQQVSEISIPVEYIDDIKVDQSLLLDFDKNGKLLEIEFLK